MLWTGSAFTLYLDDSCTGPCGSHSDAVAVWSCVRGRATLWPACPLSSLSSSLRASWRLSRLTCAPCTLRVCAVRGVSCPASTIFAGWRQSVLPVHLLGLAPLLGRIGAVAGDVKLQDDGVVHDPVNRRGGGHGVGKDAFPLREDQV